MLSERIMHTNFNLNNLSFHLKIKNRSFVLKIFKSKLKIQNVIDLRNFYVYKIIICKHLVTKDITFQIYVSKTFFKEEIKALYI